MPKSVAKIRDWYQEAVKDGEEAEDLFRHLRSYEGPDGVLVAYKASARAFLAQHTWNPLQKLKLLRESMKIFRQAVLLAPKNIEIRFLRLAIQHYIPEILSESEEIPEDLDLVVAGLPAYPDFQLTEAQAISMFRFLADSKRVPSSRIQALAEQLGLAPADL
ncbi:MAG: hypothetical protein AAF399_01170 [Bacteroidota bacterium]